MSLTILAAFLGTAFVILAPLCRSRSGSGPTTD